MSVEVLDLRGRPPAEQIRKAQAAVEQAGGGVTLRILSDQDVVATLLLAAAAGRGLRGRVEPPENGFRTMTISPGNRPESANQPEKREAN